MERHYKLLVDQLDNLMIALCKQKQLGLDVEVQFALKGLTKARNEFKRELLSQSRGTIKYDHPDLKMKLMDCIADNTDLSGDAA